MSFRLSCLILIYLLCQGCKEAPQSDTAKTGKVITLDSVIEGVLYKIDTSKSFVSWVGTEPLGWHNGTFKIKNGNLRIIEKFINAKIKKKELLSAQIVIDISSLEILDLQDNPVQYEKLKTHLFSPDFFDLDNYRTAEFEMVLLEPIERDSLKRVKNEYTIQSPTHMLSGNFTLRGKTLGIEFPVKIDYRNNIFEASAKFNINRTDWGITIRNENDPVARAKDGIIFNTVNVGFEILARPE